MGSKDKNRTSWIQLGYSKSLSAYLLGVIAGVQAYYNFDSIWFILGGGVIIGAVVSLLITTRGKTESGNWHDAWMEGINYYTRYIFSLVITFIIALLLGQFLLPMFAL